MSGWTDLNSDKALVCHREINSEAGGATVFCVVLADGFILDCGSSGYSERRAKALADVINQAGPERFTREGMMLPTHLTNDKAIS